jgi:membrane protein YqaA with SNARE-associated domain
VTVGPTSEINDIEHLSPAPVPLYSTLIVLSGYTFGAWAGAVLSYCAALTGAFVVFMLSRYLFRRLITRWLSSATSVKRVARAIEKRPQLLFLIRLAPYPYNVMNCLLGASPTLTLRTYLVCTALSLFKVIIHTALGSSIHSFARYHVQPKPSHDTAPDGGHDVSQSDGDASAEGENPIGFYAKIAGVTLAIGVFIYISVVARKAINDELGDDDDDYYGLPTHTDEEAESFLSPGGIARHSEDERDPYVNARTREPMSETPFYTPITPTSADDDDAAAAATAAVPRMRPSPPGHSRIGGAGGRNGAIRDARRQPREESDSLF